MTPTAEHQDGTNTRFGSSGDVDWRLRRGLLEPGTKYHGQCGRLWTQGMVLLICSRIVCAGCYAQCTRRNYACALDAEGVRKRDVVAVVTCTSEDLASRHDRSWNAGTRRHIAGPPEENFQFATSSCVRRDFLVCLGCDGCCRGTRPHQHQGNRRSVAARTQDPPRDESSEGRRAAARLGACATVPRQAKEGTIFNIGSVGHQARQPRQLCGWRTPALCSAVAVTVTGGEERSSRNSCLGEYCNRFVPLWEKVVVMFLSIHVVFTDISVHSVSRSYSWVLYAEGFREHDVTVVTYTREDLASRHIRFWNASGGCGWSPSSDALEHYQKDCPYRTVSFSWRDGGAVVARKAMCCFRSMEHLIWLKTKERLSAFESRVRCEVSKQPETPNAAALRGGLASSNAENRASATRSLHKAGSTDKCDSSEDQPPVKLGIASLTERPWLRMKFLAVHGAIEKPLNASNRSGAVKYRALALFIA
ncbi:hypothetical protein V5799_023532 [Amblyomma americanum]|uniref:Uncharacterized protein n=1 Tax=Amblyomma americanum TaxID=6943 RepID=A0AAQ4FJA6_AMBAM